MALSTRQRLLPLEQRFQAPENSAPHPHVVALSKKKKKPAAKKKGRVVARVKTAPPLVSASASVVG